MTTTKTFAKSIKCQVCGCTVMVARTARLPVRTCRALALANHVQTLHSHLLPRK
jgi:hypothetical protein